MDKKNRVAKISECDFTVKKTEKYLLPAGYRPGHRHKSAVHHTKTVANAPYLRGLKASMTAMTPLIPGEDPEEYKQLREEVYRDLNPPQNVVALEIADNIVQDHWLMRRARRAETAVASQHASVLSQQDWPALFSTPEIKDIEKYKKDVQARIDKTMAQLLGLSEIGKTMTDLKKSGQLSRRKRKE